MIGLVGWRKSSQQRAVSSRQSLSLSGRKSLDLPMQSISECPDRAHFVLQPRDLILEFGYPSRLPIAQHEPAAFAAEHAGQAAKHATSPPHWLQNSRPLSTGIVTAVLVASSVAVFGGFPSAAAASVARWWWPAPYAERVLEAKFRMPDKVALLDAEHELGDAMILGDPQRIDEAQDDVDVAKRGFTVDLASCVGKGPADKADRYRHFSCKLSMSSDAGNFKTIFRVVHVKGRTAFTVTTR
jgi:hypothetical protein